MDFVADILLIAGGIGAGLYCLVLSRRLARFNNLENGMGGAVAVLSAQVDDLTRALEKAQKTAAETASDLEETTHRAEDVARKLELHMAAGGDGTAGTASIGAAALGRTVRRRRRSTPAEDEAA